MGQLAVRRATSADVKQFGQRMVTDHTQANQELMKMAMKEGLSVPRELDQMHRDAIDKLSQLQGAEFDRAYMNHMLKDHEEGVALFEKEMRNGKDAGLKAFAEKTLPTLKQHLQMARTISESLKGGRNR